jgi:hypothetical protein
MRVVGFPQTRLWVGLPCVVLPSDYSVGRLHSRDGRCVWWAPLRRGCGLPCQCVELPSDYSVGRLRSRDGRCVWWAPLRRGCGLPCQCVELPSDYSMGRLRSRDGRCVWWAPLRLGCGSVHRPPLQLARLLPGCAGSYLPSVVGWAPPWVRPLLPEPYPLPHLFSRVRSPQPHCWYAPLLWEIVVSSPI